MKVFCYLTTLQKSYLFFFLLQPWISSVRLYVYYQASKNSCDTIFKFHFCVMICCRIWKFESTFEKKPIKSENMSFTYYDVQFTCGNRIHTYAKQMSDPHVALFFFFPYLTVHMRHFHEGTSTFLSSVSQRTRTCGSSHLLYDQRNKTRRQPQREKKKKNKRSLLCRPLISLHKSSGRPLS